MRFELKRQFSSILRNGQNNNTIYTLLHNYVVHELCKNVNVYFAIVKQHHILLCLGIVVLDSLITHCHLVYILYILCGVCVCF